MQVSCFNKIQEFPFERHHASLLAYNLDISIHYITSRPRQSGATLVTGTVVLSSPSSPLPSPIAPNSPTPANAILYRHPASFQTIDLMPIRRKDVMCRAPVAPAPKRDV